LAGGGYHPRGGPTPLIHVSIASERRVVPPEGVAIHRSASLETNWRFARGIPPHTFAEETVIDLVHAATNLDDVIASVTTAFARDLTSEERLRQEAAARTLRYGWDDVTRRQGAVAAQVHAALAKRGYAAPLKPCSPSCGALRRAG
jgi:hypothetical protein